MQLSPHLCEQVRVVLFHPMTQERVNTGYLPIDAEIKDLVMGCSLFKPFLEKSSCDIPGLAGLLRTGPGNNKRFEMGTKPECVPGKVRRVPGYVYLPERGELV